MKLWSPLALPFLLPFASSCHCWRRSLGEQSRLRKPDWKGGASFIPTSFILHLTSGNHYLPLTSVLLSMRDNDFLEHWQVLCTGAPAPSPAHGRCQRVWALSPADPRGASEPSSRRPLRISQWKIRKQATWTPATITARPHSARCVRCVL